MHNGSFAYDLAWEELKKRYGQLYIIAQACENNLLGFPKLDRDVVERMNKLSVLMKKSCHALVNERVSSNLDSVQFLTSLVNKFPTEIKHKQVEFSMKITNESNWIASCRGLKNFVEAHAKISNSVFDLRLFSSSPNKPDNSKKSNVSTFSAVTTSHSGKQKQDPSRNKCLYWSETLLVYQCRKFRAPSYLKKCQFVREQRDLCRACLNPGHAARKCELELKCKKRDCGSLLHNTTLHPVKSSKENENGPGASANSSSSPNEKPPFCESTANVKSLATNCNNCSDGRVV